MATSTTQTNSIQGNSQYQISNFIAKEFFDYGLMTFYTFQSKESTKDQSASVVEQGKEDLPENTQNQKSLLEEDKELQLKHKQEIDYIRWFHSFHRIKKTQNKQSKLKKKK